MKKLCDFIVKYRKQIGIVFMLLTIYSSYDIISIYLIYSGVNSMKKLKGFTLIELIVVIAIIGILSAILGLNMMNYIANSRIKSQNNNARVIFNGAQSIVQEYKFRERKEDNADRNVGSGAFIFYWDGTNGSAQQYDTSSSSWVDVADSAFLNKFSKSVNKLFTGSEDTVYKIYVENYIVKSVVSGRTDVDRYKGSYPKKSDEPTVGSISTFKEEEMKKYQ